MNFGEYIRKVRINKAISLIGNSDYSLTELHTSPAFQTRVISPASSNNTQVKTHLRLEKVCKKVNHIQKVNSIQTQTPDWSKITAILGTTGKQNGMLLQYAFARNEKTMESGMEMLPSMGMATAINFQMDGSRAAITGDFVMLADEVDEVVKALVANGITPTALHSHMLHDEPRLFTMHFWATGDPEKLAQGLKAALDKTNSKK